MTKLCIIPARGGSKRIPKKNIKYFLGKPIIAYSIETALKSNLFDEVMVSTDCRDIATIAKQYGAKVPFLRSIDNANDFATTFDVIAEVLEKYTQENKRIDFACCIYPTAPFISSELLIKANHLLHDKNFDCVFPVMPFSFPIQRAIKMDSNNKMDLFQPEFLNARSQDLERSFHDAGQFYFFKSDEILKKKKLWTNNTGVIEIDEMQGQDIDIETDWALAEIKYKLLNGKKTSI